MSLVPENSGDSCVGERELRVPGTKCGLHERATLHRRGERFVELPLVVEDLCEIAKVAGHIEGGTATLADGDCSALLLDGFVVAAEVSQHEAEVGRCDGHPRVLLSQGLLVLLNRELQSLDALPESTQVAERAAHVGES